MLLNDETLRDGLQSPSVRDPSIAEKIEFLHLMEALGINALDLGLPGAGLRAVEAVTALAREIATQKLRIKANCAARTHENDIRPIAEIVQKTGLPIEAATFIGSSLIRRFTENWTADFLLETTEKAIRSTAFRSSARQRNSWTICPAGSPKGAFSKPRTRRSSGSWSRDSTGP